MTEKEWLESIDPTSMLGQVRGTASERKIRLFACAWASAVWRHLGDERSREAVLTAERFADGLADGAELIAAYRAAVDAVQAVPVIPAGKRGQTARQAAVLAQRAADPHWDIRRATQVTAYLTGAMRYTLANYLRDLFGNPFRPEALDPGWLAWNGGTPGELARVIYDEGRFEELPVLADALEEAGCTTPALLDHLRGPGVHVRGCFVVDLLLGKS